MIKFKCIYCGCRILAKDGTTGKKGKCPKCSHPLIVPESTKGRPAISFDKEPMPDRPASPYIPAWQEDPASPHEIDRMPEDQEEALIELCKEGFGFFIPTYDFMSLLLPAMTWILLYITNSQMREWMRNGIIKLSSISEILLIVFFPLLLLLAAFLFIFVAVIPFQALLAAEIGETIDFKKKIMMFFAVLVNAGSGILIGIYVLRSSIKPAWLIIFPIWNIINCVLLLLMMLFKIIDEECMSPREVTPFRVTFGLLSLLIILSFSNYVFKLDWAITLSICIVYTTSFDRALQSVFPGLAPKEDD